MKCSVGGFPIENMFQRASSVNAMVFFDKEAENNSSITVQNSDLLQEDLQEPLDLQDLNNGASNKDTCLTPTRDNIINSVQSCKTEGIQNEENIKGLLSYTSTKLDVYDDVLGSSNSPEFYFIDSQKESEKSLENLKMQKCFNDVSYSSNLEGILNCVEPVHFPDSLLNNTILHSLEEQYMQPSKSDYKVNTEDHSETDVFCTNSVDLLSKKESEKCETCHLNNSTNDVNTKISSKIGISESLKNYKTKLDDTNPNSIVFKVESELIPTDTRRLDIYKEKSIINSEYDTSIINVKISHHRQGSNASVHSLGYTERCREVKGEAVEVSFNPETSLTAEDITESNMQVVYYEDQSLHKDANSSRDSCKLYPVSPFPAPQMQSVYSQRSMSFSEASFPAFDDRIEEEVLFDEIGEYDKIDVYTDLIESVESIADIEDNLDLSIVDLSSGEIKAGKLPNYFYD